jgi:hypothetical protein
MSGTLRHTRIYALIRLHLTSTRRNCQFHSASQSSMVAQKRKSCLQGSPSAKRAKAATEYAAATQPGIPEQTPLSTLVKAMHDHHDKIFPQNGNVIHWFRSDLRVEDNRALHAASQRAKENGKGLIALYVVSPQVSSVERPTLITRTGDTTRQPPFE